MARTTRTIYTANQAPTVTVTGGTQQAVTQQAVTQRATTLRPVTQRALQAQTTRLERSTEQQRLDRDKAQYTAFYRGQGEYSTLGADGSYRPRGTVTSGGVPVGQAVPANNGLVGGMPAGNDGDLAALAQVQERLATVAQERGPQIGEGNPNDNEAAPRYPQDHYYDSLTGNLWQWEAATEEDPGVWIILCGTLEAMPIRWDSPENDTRVIDPYQHYPVRVEALLGVSGGTVVPIPAIGEVAEVGDPIILVVTDSDPNTPLLGSILLRRVG